MLEDEGPEIVGNAVIWENAREEETINGNSIGWQLYCNGPKKRARYFVGSHRNIGKSEVAFKKANTGGTSWVSSGAWRQLA